MVSDTLRETPQSRAALVGYLAGKMQTLFPEHDLAFVLPGWVAKLSINTLVACLRQSAPDTAAALADRLVGEDAMSVQDELSFLAAAEFPRLSGRDRVRLAEFARTVRRLAIDGDGTAKDAQLYAEGHSEAEVRELMPRATRLLGLLAGSPRLDRSASPTPAARLAQAGASAAYGLRLGGRR